MDEIDLINEIAKRTKNSDLGFVQWYTRPIVKITRLQTNKIKFLTWLQYKITGDENGNYGNPNWRLLQEAPVDVITLTVEPTRIKGRYVLLNGRELSGNEDDYGDYNNLTIVTLFMVESSETAMDLSIDCREPRCLKFFVWLLGELEESFGTLAKAEYLNTLVKHFDIEQPTAAPEQAGKNSEQPEAGLNGDDQLRAELERLFPNPKTIAKTRETLFEIVKLKRTSPNLTIEQLASQLGRGEEITKRNLRRLRKHNFF